MKPVGIYLHVPFCRQKCGYCDFYSRQGDESLWQAYSQTLTEEIEYTAKEYPNALIDTIYFGGGTPTVLPPEMLCGILAGIKGMFKVINGAEITVEANPETVDIKSLSVLFDAGFNRISFGIQSGNGDELSALGRRHTASQAMKAVHAAAEAGFGNISGDIMLSIPHQTKESLVDTLDFTASLPLKHISAYMLKIEENTPFWYDGILETGEDSAADLYLLTAEYLEKKGFLQYEVSNFCKPGYESRHNLKYWRCEEYFGFGPSAHGYMNGKRVCHARSLESYIASRGQNLEVTDENAGDFIEYAMLALRLSSGLSLKAAEGIYPGEFDKAGILDRAKELEKAGLLTVDGETVRLTSQGFLLSNSVIGKLIL